MSDCQFGDQIWKEDLCIYQLFVLFGEILLILKQL